MKYKAILAIALLGLGATALQAMNADTFYTKGVALKKKGVGAMFSKDIKPMKKAMEDAVATVKAENTKAKAAGTPLYCPPAKPKMSGEQVLAEFGKIPQSRRAGLTVRQAWREIMIRKYPC